MLVRFICSLVGALFVAFGLTAGESRGQEWQRAEIVTFTDFDELEVKLDGMAHKVFLVGLRPIRENKQGMEQQERSRNAVAARWKNVELFAKVVTKHGEKLGLSLDAFVHHTKKHGFDHPWDPNKYPYCKTGWGAYNFNLYFLHVNTAEYQDNFGENQSWQEFFAARREEMKVKPQR